MRLLMIFPDHLPKPYTSVLSLNHSRLLDGKSLLLSHSTGNDIRGAQAKCWMQKVFVLVLAVLQISP